MELTVKVDDTALKRRLANIAGKDTVRRLNRSIGLVVFERTRTFLDEMAATRHKVADRLGAKPTRYLEYASGRTTLEETTEKGSTIAIKNTPGLFRAFHPLRISAVRSKYLTIPVADVSYGMRVADLRREGMRIFRPGGKNILATTEEVGRGKKKRQQLRPLYALVRSVTVPKDEGLLPKAADIREWAVDATEVFLKKEGL